jgi:hypothetical protein
MEQVVVAKKKKGRPRKDASASATVVHDDTESPEVVDGEKKKRGRKKKICVEEEECIKAKKKRGRKAAVKFFSSSIRKKIPLTTIMHDNNNYILHLDVKDDSLLKANEIEESFSALDLNDDYAQHLESRALQDTSNLPSIHTSTAKPTEESEEYISQQQNRKKRYFEMMYKFVHNKDWLEKTDVCCWWCCHTFDTVPIGMPNYFDLKIKKFRVNGVFCSFPCVMSYCRDRRQLQNYPLIKQLYRNVTASSLDSDILFAPSRYTLKIFGGDLTIDEFREASNSNERIYRMIEYPMYMSRSYVEEVDIANVKSANTKVFKEGAIQKLSNLDSERVAEARSRVLEKEKIKNIERTGNTIDKFIKIF